MNPYDILGVPKDADSTAIKRAYRKKARQSHPDRGGKTEDMAAINDAYALLSDNGRRARYDSDGTINAEQDESTKIQMALVSLFLQAIEAGSANPMAEMRRQLAQQIEEQRGRVAKMKQKAKRFDKASKKIKRKTAGENMLKLALESQRDIALGNVTMMEENVDLGVKILEALNEYEYEAEIALPNRSPSGMPWVDYTPLR